MDQNVQVLNHHSSRNLQFHFLFVEHIVYFLRVPFICLFFFFFCLSRLFSFSGCISSALQSLLFHCPRLHMAGHPFSSLNFTWDYVQMVFIFTSPHTSYLIFNFTLAITIKQKLQIYEYYNQKIFYSSHVLQAMGHW